MTTETTPAAPAGTGVQLMDARQSLGLAKLADLFPEGPEFRRSLVTFSVLLTLAGIIASLGLYQDSVASIIGAMVVAPLGGAIMAFAGALVTARLRWMAITAVQVALGALGVIAIGFLVAWLMPTPLELTPSLAARTSPGILDLGVALAAGGAGAYVAVRRTGTDALPGVAIAVSLVPPLATVGICLQLGLLPEATGALLLFLMNFAAIVVAACVVFTLHGAAPPRELVRERRQVRNGVIVAVIAAVLVAIPLVINGVGRGIEMVRATTGAPLVLDWIGERDLRVTDWSISGSVVTIRLEGPDAPGDPAELARALAGTYGAPVELEVRYAPTVESDVRAEP